MIERLEARIAPAALSASGKLLTYTDGDGDLVHVTFTSPMAQGDFLFSSGSVDGDISIHQDLSMITLTGKPAGIGLTLSASPQNGQGDSHANIEYINATGLDLGKITIDGDLHRITAGNQNTPGLGIKSLTVSSMGMANDTLGTSSIDGIGSLVVKTNLRESYLIINHNQGGSISIGGSLLGTDTFAAAHIQVSGPTGSVKIGGSLLGGVGDETAKIVLESVGSLTVGGSVLGGIDNSNDITIQIDVSGNAGSISIKGDLVGRSADHNGSIHVGGNVNSISIGGSVRGGPASYTGLILVGGDAGKVSIGHDLIAGDNTTTNNLTDIGSIIAGGKIGTVTIGGVFAAGELPNTGQLALSGMISAHTTIGSVSVGEIKGAYGRQVLIEAAGNGLLGNANAIGSVTVKGSCTFGTMVAGYETGLTEGNFASGIGSVKVGGDFIASRVVVSIQEGGNGVIGDFSDIVKQTGAIIGLVKIGGVMEGNPGSAERFGIEGEVVNKVQIADAVYTRVQLHATPLRVGPGLTAWAESFT